MQRLCVFLGILSLIKADSIILTNQCQHTSEECTIQLETINGEPGRDCYVFSSDTRRCVAETAIGELATSDMNAVIHETSDGTVVSFNGQTVSDSRHSDTKLTGSSVWNRPGRAKRSENSGVVINCICRPVYRTKRDLTSIQSVSQVSAGSKSDHVVEKLLDNQNDECKTGFKNTSERTTDINDPIIIRKVSARSSANCGKLCNLEFLSKSHCAAFAYSEKETDSDDCLLLRAEPTQVTGVSSNFQLYTRC